MILVWFDTVISTSVTPGQIKPFDIFLWVQILIFRPKHPPSCNVASAFIVEHGNVFGQEINTCTGREMQISSKFPRVIPVDVTIAKNKFNLIVYLF